MKVWQKAIVLVAAVVIIAVFIMWWMSYEPMKIVIKNERNESINVSIALLTLDDVKIFNDSFSLNENESIAIENITTFASAYYLVVTVNDTNITQKEKIKYGKYYEVIEIVIGEEGVEVRNNRAVD